MPSFLDSGLVAASGLAKATVERSACRNASSSRGSNRRVAIKCSYRPSAQDGPSRILQATKSGLHELLHHFKMAALLVNNAAGSGSSAILMESQNPNQKGSRTAAEHDLEDVSGAVLAPSNTLPTFEKWNRPRINMWRHVTKLTWPQCPRLMTAGHLLRTIRSLFLALTTLHMA